MGIVGFNFNGITIERKEHHKGNININNNISIKEVEKREIPLPDKASQGIVFRFEFVSKYTPEIAALNIQGDIMYLAEQKIAKKLLERWNKEKKVDPDIMAQVLNAALNKCNIKALELSDDLNLPPPVPLPRVNVQKGKQKSDQSSYIG